jgi:hypothetical protein
MTMDEWQGSEVVQMNHDGDALVASCLFVISLARPVPIVRRFLQRIV